MSTFRTLQSLLRPSSPVFRNLGLATRRRSPYQLRTFLHTSKGQDRHRPSHHNANRHKPQPEVELLPDQDHYVSEEQIRRVMDGASRIKVRYLGPGIFAVAVSAGIYVYLAYRQADEETRPSSYRQYRPPAWPHSRDLPGPTEVMSQYWRELNPISKVSAGIIATCGAIHLQSFIFPKYWNSLWHMPARNLPYTLFTSTFVHSGALHLGFNMWACYNFLLPTGYSRAFEGNPYHVLSFFLSTGVLTAYAQHFATKFARPTYPPAALIPSGGASGALFSIFAVFCMQYPDAGVGIIFLPFSFPAINFLPCVMLFDLYGMVKGYKALNFGHAAHLSGMLIGIAYSAFDGKSLIWNPLVRYFKRSLQEKRRT
ncbi:hypothetical protein CC78DRAFT_529725 [Lojkania enalia]|uniref:Peptidase S54 rhomboid domain-containing protein n=1 Tax=Lojkania enalia TaxID=147567 RepID=A0A9P4N8C6_9PLEO|nr:hypothetical protein CC78DRAFT_529725 [Didymosphaeria enalia]